jgi:hypothetical protein
MLTLLRNLALVLPVLVVSGNPVAPPRIDTTAPLVEGDVDDPLVHAAGASLAARSIDPVRSFVSPADLPLAEEALARALAVRNQSPAGRAVADEYFVLTIERLNQIGGTGERYTGDDDVDAVIARSIEEGRVEPAVNAITARVEAGARARMKHVLAARKKIGGNNAAARLTYVDACLELTRYLERLAVAAADAVDPAAAAFADDPD